MMIVKASKNSEGPQVQNNELMKAMDDYDDQLIEAGVRVMAKGLHPSSNGLRVSFTHPGQKPIVTEGPFPHVNELVAGFFLIDVKSKEEAIEWLMKAPDPQGDGEGQIELRQVF
jgi:hypothetical protein